MSESGVSTQAAGRAPQVVVVGGGPAGLMACEAAADLGVSVTLIEAQANVGRKFLLAGRGGLNLTHSQALADFLAAYRGDPWVVQTIRNFPPEALRAWVQGLGIDSFVGSSGRVFPVGMKASPLLRAWLARLRELGVGIETRRRLTGLGPGPSLQLDGPTGPETVSPAAVVLALGGASWPRLGSDGRWQQWLDVPSTPLTAANVGMVVPWSDQRLSSHAGSPLKPVLGWVAKTPRANDCQPVRGECILTHEGLEGGLIYGLNAALRSALAEYGEAILSLDMLPDLPLAELTARLGTGPTRRSFGERLRRATGASPAKLALLQAARALGPTEHPRLWLADLKTVQVRISATRPITEAISTAGGIAARAHDAAGMLLTHPGVFVAGEMLDWDAPTGGYLLTACFATGRAAGQAAAHYALNASL